MANDYTFKTASLRATKANIGTLDADEIKIADTRPTSASGQRVDIIDLIMGTEKVGVIESWRDGYNWYRKYSDGWIEQGGGAISNN